MSSKKTKECPFCGEIIKAIAVKCRFCAEFLVGQNHPSAKPGIDDDDGEETCQADESEYDDPDVLYRASPSLFAATGAFVRASLILVLAPSSSTIF